MTTNPYPASTMERAIFEAWQPVAGIIQARCTPEEVAAINAAMKQLSAGLRSAGQADSDAAFGKGHREGRALGHAEGWTQRDESAAADIAAASQANAAMMAAAANTIARLQRENAALKDENGILTAALGIPSDSDEPKGIGTILH